MGTRLKGCNFAFAQAVRFLSGFHFDLYIMEIVPWI